MRRRPIVHTSLLALVAIAAWLAAIPLPSAAATCQSWGAQPPEVGDEWSRLDDVAVISPCMAVAVGTFRNAGAERALIQRWNGTKWSIVDVPDFGETHDGLLGIAAASAKDIWAVGSLHTAAFEERALIVHWNGTSWREVATPVTGRAQLSAVDVVARDDAWAVGHRYVSGQQEPLILHWNGQKWKSVTVPDTGELGAALYAVDASGPGAAWAVGARDNDTRSLPLAMRWNGTSWRVRQAPTIDDGSHELHGVVTTSGSKAWAVGSSSDGMGWNSILLRWNGTAWKAVPHPEGDGGGQLRALEATSATNIWAVGSACDLSDRCDSRVLHFDGSGWVVMQSATLGDGTSLYGIDASSASNAWAVGTTSAPSTSTPFALHCC